MSGTQRPLDSGRTDSLGRTIRVADTASESRADAPPPGLTVDVDTVLYECAADHNIRSLADLDRLTVADRTELFGPVDDATWEQVRAALANHPIITADRAVYISDNHGMIVMPYDGDLDDRTVTRMVDRLKYLRPELTTAERHDLITDQSTILFQMRFTPTGPDTSELVTHDRMSASASSQFAVADMRPQPAKPFQPFDSVERRLLDRRGVDPKTAELYAACGIRRPEAIAAYNDHSGLPVEAAHQVAAGSPGPAAASERPRTLRVRKIGDLPHSETPHQSSYGTASAGTRNWDGAYMRVDTTIGKGLPSFQIVGAGGDDQRAVRDRVRAAIISSGFEWPSGKITVDRGDRETGHMSDSRQDAAIVVSILEASGQIDRRDSPHREVWGTVGLDGTVHDVES